MDAAHGEPAAVRRGSHPDSTGFEAGLDPHAVGAWLSHLETTVYLTLTGLVEELELLARLAEPTYPQQAMRARLLASDVGSRGGEVEQAYETQLQLHARAVANGWYALAQRASMYLVSTCDRLGKRADCLDWARAALDGSPEGFPAAWRAEALMVLTLMTTSRPGFDYALLEHAIEQVRKHCSLGILSVTLANFAEVACECGDVGIAQELADGAITVLRRHPEVEAALTWESIARVRLAAGDLAQANHALTQSLRVGERLGYCDVNGDPYLTLAELRLAQGMGQEALAMLDHPVRQAAAEHSAWVATRELEVRARILAQLERWREAYEAMVRYAAAYQEVRSVEAERAAAESEASQTAVEERRRASTFEQLAMRDALTGLPNRRFADDRLETLAEEGDSLGADQGGQRRGGVRWLSVAILDIDHFKQINDTYSHDGGDRVLVGVGRLMLEVVEGFRNQDGLERPDAQEAFVARLGGEEFVIVMPDVPREVAIARCEHLLDQLRAASFAFIAPGIRVRASLGLVTSPLPANRSAMLRAADACLYEAKRTGRDRLVVAPEPTAAAC